MTPQELTQKIAQRTELWQQLGKEVFQFSLGDDQYDKNYKKNQEQLGNCDAGEIIIDKTHPLGHPGSGTGLKSSIAMHCRSWIFMGSPRPCYAICLGLCQSSFDRSTASKELD